MNLIIKSVLFILISMNSYALENNALSSTWSGPNNYKKPSKEELKGKLTQEQYTCTQEEGTEKPFQNAYWDNKADGIYVDLVSGEPLFSSIDKYDSGSGWPSFTKPIEADHLTFKTDTKLGAERTEVRSKYGDSHLGHVFDDGPKEAGGKRYCMNSAALNFIPLNKLKEKGYGQYLFLFAKIKNWEVATLSGGCFWGVEEILRKEVGVIETQVGYIGGKSTNPNYKSVKSGQTGHVEAVQILFDSKKKSYENLLVLFFRLHDPTTKNRQGNDVGTQYRSSIFYSNEDQRLTSEKMKIRVEASGVWKKPVLTEIVKAKQFWRAEDFHQKYLEKKPKGYTCHYVRDYKF
ncbi:MAG: bifunctional methionine sulfoxide reductase B/A protein [Oligoflexia bacterium]|nr:bifunctional methionine sulfoxide reductase B/A protein [Oligoflexia bacterium]